jgi:uncharacterized protein YqjF (DUF2071 family)
VSASAPDFPWIFGQTYEHLLLVHWPVPADHLARLLPHPLTPALFEGKAWIGHDVYVGANAQLRPLPAVPDPLARRPVVTLRTIVDARRLRGIHLLSLDAESAAAAWVEHTFLNVHSHAADVTIGPEAAGGGWVAVACQRTSGRPARLHGRYRAVGPEAPLVPGSRDEFLLGGDRMFTAGHARKPAIIEVQHGPWTLAPAEVTFTENTIPGVAGLPGPGDGLVATFQRTQQAYVAAPRPLR